MGHLGVIIHADILLCGVAETGNSGEVFSIAGKGII